MFPANIVKLAETVLSEARAHNLKIVTAESCTGGLVGGALTEIAGSSDVFERGFITYSNKAKQEILGVGAELLRGNGAVSEATVRAMAEGALKHAHADVSVAITGIAGPGGGTATKPVGLVHFAAARKGQETIAEEKRFGDLGRGQVRLLSVEFALTLIRRQLA